MHPLEYTGLIDAANSNQRQDFLSFAGNAHRSSLNTGLFNFLRDEQGQTDCTDGYAIFSGRGQNARSDKGGVFRADAETSNYNAGMNFWSCALFPNVTSALLDDGLSLQNETFLPDHYAQPVAGTSATVVSFLSVCLSSWCGESSDCNASSCAMEQLTIGDSMLSAASVDTCLDHLCSLSAKKRSNPDIAGIGVIISYFIQYAFTAAGLCGLLVCAILIRWNIRRTKSQSGRDCPDEKSDSSSSLPIVLSVKETLVMALDDFQRAQCSFAIAINIASLVTLQLRSHAISYVDRRAMIAGSASGTLSTCLVLAALMESNKRHSKFTFWLTFTTWAISLSVGLHPQIFKYRDSTSDYLTKYPPVCGKSPPVNAGNYNPLCDDFESSRWIPIHG
ncbi:hypothetical protein T440DRAFT_510194 [Plenodomus tracheiphilus IPT5]|uniref:Uncharacterized protein n=1 Tax=Plenodomus tracheiphilus IPT5 TaxID=1408161 RepID=A0A6A7AW73_9PLEO|nr:hypothetical protein T440DRAFT_510194 [Plenodomus tracheiphilus IPT5]